VCGISFFVFTESNWQLKNARTPGRKGIYKEEICIVALNEEFFFPRKSEVEITGQTNLKGSNFHE